MTDTTTLRRLAEAATPGPWHDKMHCTVNSGHPHFEVVADTEMDHERMTENAAYIAAVHPAAVLALLDEVERLRAEVARLQPKPPAVGYGSIGHCGCWSRGTYGGEHYEFKCDMHKAALGERG